MDGGARQRLGEREHVRWRGIGTVARARTARGAGATPSSEPGTADAVGVDAHRAHEREVVVGEPLEEGRGLGDVAAVDAPSGGGRPERGSEARRPRRASRPSRPPPRTRRRPRDSIASRSVASSAGSVSRSISRCRCDVTRRRRRRAAGGTGGGCRSPAAPSAALTLSTRNGASSLDDLDDGVRRLPTVAVAGRVRHPHEPVAAHGVSAEREHVGDRARDVVGGQDGGGRAARRRRGSRATSCSTGTSAGPETPTRIWAAASASPGRSRRPP